MIFACMTCAVSTISNYGKTVLIDWIHPQREVFGFIPVVDFLEVLQLATLAARWLALIGLSEPISERSLLSV